MKISDLMTRDVATVAPDATAFDAARMMWQHDCGFVPVVHPLSQKVLGIVTDRDLCMASFTQGLPLRDIPLGPVMSRAVCECRPTDDLEEVHAKLRSAQVHRLPVIDERGRLVGVVSLNDLARHAARKHGPSASSERAAVAETLGRVNAPRTSTVVA
jgi:CBS domain-containing protein